MIRAFYNEIDPYCCAWLSNLMDAGEITPGTICDTSITDLSPDRFGGFDRVHFFAGIGGWDYALNLVGWGERPVSTGSCPCQPFSAAGRRGGSADRRHLWPAWLRLIRECRPVTIFGEQVVGAVGFGWLDRVFADLEACDYACASVVLGAHSVGAPHIRQRLFWVADAESGRQWHSGNRKEIQGAIRTGCGAGFWDRFDRIPRVGTWRIEPETSPLAPRIPGYVGPLRAYGNAIVPQVAAEFVAAFMECRP